MEYCSTTLRKLIDDREISKMDSNEVWRLARQIIEALVYIHSRNIIHRDLVRSQPGFVLFEKYGVSSSRYLFATKKPGNIFLDSEGNVRLGDFGLATKRKDTTDTTSSTGEPDFQSSGVGALYHAIDDIRPLLGGSAQFSNISQFSVGESITGGVGTAFYRAPEQEGNQSRSSERKAHGSYNIQADIFSLGIILFEMFYPPFGTVRHDRMHIFWPISFLFCLPLLSVHGTFGDIDQT